MRQNFGTSWKHLDFYKKYEGEMCLYLLMIPVIVGVSCGRSMIMNTI